MEQEKKHLDPIPPGAFKGASVMNTQTQIQVEKMVFRKTNAHLGRFISVTR